MDIEEKVNEEYQVSKINMTCDNVPTEIDDKNYILSMRTRPTGLLGTSGTLNGNI